MRLYSIPSEKRNFLKSCHFTENGTEIALRLPLYNYLDIFVKPD